MAKDLWKLALKAPEAETDLLQAMLARKAGFGWEEKGPIEGANIFEISCENLDLLEEIAKDAKALPGVSAEILKSENRNWQSAWREYFTPVEAGTRYVILPPWLAHLEHSSREEIIINPKNAFGTGHHASTTLCLAALSELLDQKRLDKHDWFLDIGCGTGILGIAACKAGMSGTGIDIDPVAIDNSRENRELNEAERLELLKGGIEKVKGAKYDLVMANILAEPLIEMAPAIKAALEPNGCLILGGILDKQADAVASAYIKLGMKEPRVMADGEWRALVWE